MPGRSGVRDGPPSTNHHPLSGLVPPKRAQAREGGFTLVEMLVATAIMLTITGAVFQLMHPAQGVFRAQSETSDTQQRLRVSADSLRRDLVMAGAGPDAGATAASLGSYFAPVLPYRVGDVKSDPAADVFFRRDAISLVYVPAAAPQTTIRESLPVNSNQLRVEPQANCPPFTANRLCGFDAGLRVMLFDSNGQWDPVTIAGVQDQSLELTYEGSLSAAYAKGTRVTQVVMHTYYVRSDAGTNTYQLMHYDGATTDLPVVDDIVKLEFEYFGESQPPVRLVEGPSTMSAGRWTSYGPMPPEVGALSPLGWPAGENCVFMVVAGQHVPRLPALGRPGLVPLEPAVLTDGPWCPHSSAPGRFDADLLRVRRVRVTLRARGAVESLRSRGALFVRTGGAGVVPDQQIQFDVAPRSLSLGR
jgi:prepilin-type N-terminal cleavage/methylation domain-containing protein